MEAEQSSYYYREYPLTFGQKREKVGVGQSDTANSTLCRYCLQVNPFLAKKEPGAHVFGHFIALLISVQPNLKENL